MDEATLKTIARQLRQPSGEYATQVGEKMNEGNLHINLSTVEALQLTENDNVLEIGMGNGFFVKNILSADPTIKYTGCDFSETMVNEALRHNSEFINSGRAQFQMANAEDLPFSNSTFTKVFTVNTIYFWDDQQRVLSEIRRVLRPGGYVYISVRPKSVMKFYPFVKYGFTMFDKDDLTKLLTQNRFNVVNTIEKEEPDQEVGGQKMKVETLIVCAEKIL